MPAYTHMQASISEKGISSPIFSRILDGMLIVRWDEQRLWVWILPSSPCLSIHCVPCPGISWSWRFKLEVSPGRSECMCLQAARSREAGVHPIHPSGPQGSVVSITCSQPTASVSWRNAWRGMWPWPRSASFLVSFDHWEGCLEEGFGIQCTWESSRNARQDPFPRESAHFLNLSIFTRASAEINFMDRFFIFICNFCLASNKQSKASSFSDTGLVIPQSIPEFAQGSPLAAAQPTGGRHGFPSSFHLFGRCNKNLSLLDNEKTALPQLLGNSGSLFLVLIGFLIGLFMGCATAWDKKAGRAIMCLAFLSGRS